MKETLMDQAEHLARMVCKLLRPSLAGEGPVVDTIDLRKLHELAYAWLDARHDPSIPDPASAVPALVGALERALKIEEARLEDRRQLFFEDELDGDAEYCAIRDNRDEYRAALALAKGGKR